MLNVGQRIRERYRVDKLIGAGGMGLVYQGFDEQRGERVAIKMLKPEVINDTGLVKRFYRECEALRGLKHPHIVDMVEVLELEDGTPVLITELLKGRDLHDECAERGQLPVDEAVGYVIQACAAVSMAHRRSVVHRDIKPRNLYLTQMDGDRCLKLLDFGISKLSGELDDSTMTHTGTMLGTPHYMSPEQIRSSHDVDERTDVWSLGVVLFTLLTSILRARSHEGNRETFIGHASRRRTVGDGAHLV